jgi:hypothetical protein
MPLEFWGLAITNPSARGVRFTAHPNAGTGAALVICEVSADALLQLGRLPDASEEELMGIFELYKEVILEIVTKKYLSGVARPMVTVTDVYALSE